MSKEEYVHGYSKKETKRLVEQANTVAKLIHEGVIYPKNTKILEVGCGVGAQTISLARNNPSASITSIDISDESLKEAKELIKSSQIKNVKFQKTDVHKLPFDEESFDHVFICFLLEHLPDPIKALSSLKKILKKGGSITVFEGDHGSCYFYPETNESRKAWKCLIDCQANLGGDSLIGRSLYPLLNKAGFNDINVTPKMIYIDSSKPELVDGFIKKTIIPMVEGVKVQAFKSNMIDKLSWEKGIKDIHKTASHYGTFCYTFFKARALKK